MDKLFLPKGAIIQGERISVSHEGDIQIENNLVPLSIKSQHGSIFFIPESSHVNCSHLIAEQGQIAVHAESVQADLISGKNVLLDVGKLEVTQAIQSKEKTELTGTSLKTGDLIAGSLEINLKGDLVADSIAVEGVLTLCAGNLKVNQIKAEQVKMEITGKLECEHLVSEKDVYIEKGSVAIKYLDCQSFTASPQVSGIILVATPEHVKAEGVRGFIRPQEFKAFSDQESFLQISPGKNRETKPRKEEENPPQPMEEPEAFEPEIMTPAPPLEIEIEPEAAFDTLDVQEMESVELENQAEEIELETSLNNVEIEEATEFPSLESELDDPEMEEMPPPAPEFDPSEGNQSLDDISMVTLNMEEDAEENLVSDGELDMDTISEEQAISIDLEEVDEEFTVDSPDSDFEESLDSLTALSEEEELAMDSIDLDSFDQEQSVWELNQPEEAFPLSETGAELPEEEDDFRTTELNFPDNEGVEISEDFGAEDLSFGPNQFTIDEIQTEDATGDFDSMEIMDDIPEMTEDELVEKLETTIAAIKDCFPDENFPKFISQIEVYLVERRFPILRKKRNREAVISSFDRLANPRISDLAREFYQVLTGFFNDEL